jgi:hypothetical protein
VTWVVTYEKSIKATTELLIAQDSPHVGQILRWICVLSTRAESPFPGQINQRRKTGKPCPTPHTQRGK